MIFSCASHCNFKLFAHFFFMHCCIKYLSLLYFTVLLFSCSFIFLHQLFASFTNIFCLIHYLKGFLSILVPINTHTNTHLHPKTNIYTTNLFTQLKYEHYDHHALIFSGILFSNWLLKNKHVKLCQQNTRMNFIEVGLKESFSDTQHSVWI